MVRGGAGRERRVSWTCHLGLPGSSVSKPGRLSQALCQLTVSADIDQGPISRQGDIVRPCRQTGSAQHAAEGPWLHADVDLWQSEADGQVDRLFRPPLVGWVEMEDVAARAAGLTPWLAPHVSRDLALCGKTAFMVQGQGAHRKEGSAVGSVEHRAADRGGKGCPGRA